MKIIFCSNEREWSNSTELHPMQENEEYALKMSFISSHVCLKCVESVVSVAKCLVSVTEKFLLQILITK